MTCTEYQEWLQNRLDGDNGENADALCHIQECTACRLVAAATARVFLNRPNPGWEITEPLLTERIVKAIAVDRVFRQRRRRLVYAAVSLAASVLIGISFYSVYFAKNSDGMQSGPSNNSVQKGPDQLANSELSPREHMAEAGAVVASLSTRATEETLKQTRLLLPVATAPLPFDSLTVKTGLEPPTDSIRQAGKGLSEGIKPVTDSARRAWDLFLREVPPLGENVPSKQL